MSILSDDIVRFFNIFEERNEELFSKLDPQHRTELTEELTLLRQSVVNRVLEETPAQ